MNVLILSNMYPDTVRSVNGVFIRYQVSELSNRSHNLVVLSPQPYVPPIPGLPKRYRKLHTEVAYKKEESGISVFYPRTLSLPDSRTQPITALISRFRSSTWIEQLEYEGFIPDIINAHVAQPNGFAAIPISEYFEVPLVTTIHGADLNLLYDQFVNRLFIDKVIQRSDAVIVNSTTLKNSIPEKYRNTEQIHVVPNGIPLDLIEKQKDRTCPAEINKSKPTIISVGDLIHSKGHDTVLEALHSVSSEYQYIIIGDGPRQSALKNKAKSLGIEDIQFIGEISNKDVFRYLWHSQLFALASYREAFGIAYIEAMACELPVIGCRGEGPEEYIEHGENGFLVRKEHPDDIKNCIERVLGSQELRNKVGVAARETATEYSWAKNGERVESIYESLVESSLQSRTGSSHPSD